MQRRILFLTATLGLWARLAATAPAVTVTPVTAASLKKAIAGYKGHVVLVNFWATWCPPCMKEYPGLVQISRQYANKGLVVLAVSGDKPKDIPTKIRPFLARQKASFPQFVIMSDLDTFVDAFQPKWQADFPQTFVYDRRGRLVRELRGEQNLQMWRSAFVPLLGKSVAR